MRLIAPGETAPANVSKYLLPHERQVLTVRLHPAVLIPRGATAAAGLLVAFVVHSKGYPHLIVWLLAFSLLGEFLWACVDWSISYFVVTTDRMLVTSGIGTRRVSETPLDSARDADFYRTKLGRLLGYGAFVFPSASKAMTIVDFLPYPEQLYLEMRGIIYPSSMRLGDD